MDFDAFVVLHGTDTMSYSSSALGFLLEDLGKTVVSPLPSIPDENAHASVADSNRRANTPVSASKRCCR